MQTLEHCMYNDSVNIICNYLLCECKYFFCISNFCDTCFLVEIFNITLKIFICEFGICDTIDKVNDIM